MWKVTVIRRMESVIIQRHPTIMQEPLTNIRRNTVMEFAIIPIIITTVFVIIMGQGIMEGDIITVPGMAMDMVPGMDAIDSGCDEGCSRNFGNEAFVKCNCRSKRNAGCKRGFMMRSEQEVSRAMERYGDTIRRLCVMYLKNYADTEDIFQTVFLKYVLSSAVFENEEHEKAWFIRVTINACKDLLKSFFRSRTVSLDEVLEQPAPMPPDYREVLEAVLSLPKKYREVIYLHYYEGFTAPQIGRILGKNVNTVYTLLTRARAMLKERLGGDAYELEP